MRAHIEAGNVLGLYTVILEDGRVFHDRDAFQVRDMIERMGLVEISSRTARAERIIEIVQRELGAGVDVTWTAAADRIALTCVHGGRTHTLEVDPPDEVDAAAEAWCREILATA